MCKMYVFIFLTVDDPDHPELNEAPWSKEAKSHVLSTVAHIFNIWNLFLNLLQDMDLSLMTERLLRLAVSKAIVWLH